MRESSDVCVASVLGVRFSSFLVRNVKRKRQRDSEEGFVIPLGWYSCRIENVNFLVLH